MCTRVSAMTAFAVGAIMFVPLVLATPAAAATDPVKYGASVPTSCNSAVKLVKLTFKNTSSAAQKRGTQVNNAAVVYLKVPARTIVTKTFLATYGSTYRATNAIGKTVLSRKVTLNCYKPVVTVGHIADNGTSRQVFDNRRSTVRVTFHNTVNGKLSKITVNAGGSYALTHRVTKLKPIDLHTWTVRGSYTHDLLQVALRGADGGLFFRFVMGDCGTGLARVSAYFHSTVPYSGFTGTVSRNGVPVAGDTGIGVSTTHRYDTASIRHNTAGPPYSRLNVLAEEGGKVIKDVMAVPVCSFASSHG